MKCIKFGVIVLLLFGIAIALFGIGAPVSANSSSKWVSGYYTGYNSPQLPADRIYWDGLTQIVMGAVLANSDGTLDQTFYINPTDGPALARNISALAHTHNKKAILMLGGEGNGASIASAVQNHRTFFISNLVTAMNTYGYDGIDLDWEDSVDYTQFASFAKDLRAAAPNAILTVPVGCINPNYQTVDPGIVVLNKYVDQINLMSYNPGTAYNGYGWYSWFNSPLKGEKSTTPVSIENSLSLYNASGIPKSKLGMGISFNAVGYAGTPVITGPDQPTGTTNWFVGGDNQFPLSMFFKAGGEYDTNQNNLHWSNEAFEPYLSLPTPDSFGARFVSFEDPQSIIEKGNFTRNNGYGGIIIWTINQGYVSTSSDPNFLMEALQTGFMAPVIYSISPASGPVTGGSTVTITGTGFTGTSAVYFGSKAATGITVSNSTSITVTSPPYPAAGTVDITVTTPGGTSVTSPADVFNYGGALSPLNLGRFFGGTVNSSPSIIVPLPTITRVSPNNGPMTGGTNVTITGTGFSGTTIVYFGSIVATHVTVINNSTIDAIAPIGATKTVDITVSTSGGTSTKSSADRFTYTTPPTPTITRISPDTGPVTGGTNVTITGTGFSGTSIVYFGSIVATHVTVVNGSTIYVTAPAGAAKPVDVTITTSGGTSTKSSTDRFTYIPGLSPVIRIISPMVGQINGGDGLPR